jgi:hypothetical protein
MSWIEKISYKGVSERLETVIKRFPVAVLFTIIYTIIALMLLWDKDLIPNSDALFFIIMFYPPTALLLGVSLHLWSEEQTNFKRAHIVHLIAQVCWLFYCVIIAQQSQDSFGMELVVGLLATLFLFKASIFFLSFLGKKTDIESWNFSWNIILSALQTTLVSGILLGGIELLLWGIQELFDLDIPEELYISMVIICMFTVNVMLLMMQMPKDEAKHDTNTHRMNDFGRMVVHGLFVPLQAAYLITLYFYLLRILFTWELPSGGVVWLVTTMMIGLLFITALVYPLLLQDNKPFDKKLVRWLALLALPLLVLMTVGICRRVSDYGFTVARAYVLLFNIWCYVVCIYLLFKQGKRIMWILTSFVLVFFIASVGPWNMTATTRRLLTRQVDGIFLRTGVQLPLDYTRFDSLIQTMDKHEADILKGKLSYLKFELQGDSLVSRWIDGLVDLHTNPYYEGPSEPFDTDSEPIDPATIESPFANMREEMASLPQGNFLKVMQIDDWQREQVLAETDSTLYMDIIYSQDTLLYNTRFGIPFRQLQEIAADESKQQPFTVENNEGALLIWYFEVESNASKDNDDDAAEKAPVKKDLHLEGLLFLREAAFKNAPLSFEDEETKE